GDDAHAVNSIRGSISTAAASDSAEPISTASTAPTVSAASSGKSSAAAESTRAAAIPGQPNTASTTAAPAISSGSRVPSNANVGNTATGAMWPRSKGQPSMPRARAPRTASEAAASTTAVRVVSSSHGSWETVNAVNGSTAWVSTPGTVYSAPGGAAPETGSQRKPTATPATSASETTNGGTAANTTAKVLLSRSDRKS